MIDATGKLINVGMSVAIAETVIDTSFHIKVPPIRFGEVVKLVGTSNITVLVDSKNVTIPSRFCKIIHPEEVTMAVLRQGHRSPAVDTIFDFMGNEVKAGMKIMVACYPSRWEPYTWKACTVTDIEACGIYGGNDTYVKVTFDDKTNLKANRNPCVHLLIVE